MTTVKTNSARRLNLGGGVVLQLPTYSATGTQQLIAVATDGLSLEQIDVPAGAASAGAAGALQSSDGASAFADSGIVITGGNTVFPGTTKATAIEANNGLTAANAYLYNTDDGGGNYERLRVYVAGSVFQIRSEAAGTGTVRNISLAGSRLILDEVLNRTTLGAITGGTYIKGNTYFYGSGTLMGAITSTSIGPYSTATWNSALISTPWTSSSAKLMNAVDSTTPGIIDLYATRTSATSYELLKMQYSGSYFRLFSEKGSAGGSFRGISIGGANTPVSFYNITPVAQAAHIADPAGGATVDAEARTAINAILVALENIGITAAA